MISGGCCRRDVLESLGVSEKVSPDRVSAGRRLVAISPGVIKTTDVRIIPFDEVTADYAWDGGEEDRDLASWREIYWAYIERECQRIGLEPTTKAPLVMERFRLVYGELLAAPDKQAHPRV